MVDSLSAIEGGQKVWRHSGVSPENVPIILMVVLDHPEPVFALGLVPLIVLLRFVIWVGLDTLAPVVNNSPIQLFNGNISEEIVLAILKVEAYTTLESVATIEMEWRPAGHLWLWLLFLLLLWFRPSRRFLLLVAHDQA